MAYQLLFPLSKREAELISISINHWYFELFSDREKMASDENVRAIDIDRVQETMNALKPLIERLDALLE